MNIGPVTVDFDSTVMTREGRQPGAALGYNPNRRGRHSHHPLLAFTIQFRLAVYGSPFNGPKHCGDRFKIYELF